MIKLTETNLARRVEHRRMLDAEAERDQALELLAFTWGFFAVVLLVAGVAVVLLVRP